MNPKYQFNNFIEGKSNQLARFLSYKFTENIKNIYNSLFLYSDTGLGKTHLLHAIGNKFLIDNYNIKVIYIHSKNFIENMIHSIQNNSIEHFKNYYSSINVLLIDDIQLFSYKKYLQKELFYIFKKLFEKNQKIILSSDRYPNYINGINKNLQFYFKQGLIIPIKSPELITRTYILLKKAYKHKIYLPYKSAQYIAKNLYSNIRELKNFLKKIYLTSLFLKKKIKIHLIQREFKRKIQKKKNIDIKLIQKKVSIYFKIKISDMISKKRSKFIVRSRQIAMTLIKKLTNYSFSDIGVAFGKKHRTTVMYAYKKINQLKKKNKLYYDFLYLFNQLNS
nr:chromosomal replication initiator protein DnaA [Buchnera aphidicola]